MKTLSLNLSISQVLPGWDAVQLAVVDAAHAAGALGDLDPVDDQPEYVAGVIEFQAMIARLNETAVECFGPSWIPVVVERIMTAPLDADRWGVTGAEPA